MSQVASGGTAPPVDSTQMQAAVALTGECVPVEDKAVAEQAGAPTLHARRFTLRDLKAVRGDLRGQHEVAFTGFTRVAPSQRLDDPRAPSISFEAQRFFDGALARGRVLLLIGGAAASSQAGPRGESAQVTAGPWKGQPVRPFLLDGADRDLAGAVSQLAGWQAGGHLAGGALSASAHPLLVLDALRVAVRGGASAEAAVAARWLVHPSLAPEIKVTALRLVGEALARATPGSAAAEALVNVVIRSYEVEFSHPVEQAQVEALLAGVATVQASSRLPAARLIATDDNRDKRLRQLQAELAGKLGK